jgi:hypothetical protein
MELGIERLMKINSESKLLKFLKEAIKNVEAERRRKRNS